LPTLTSWEIHVRRCIVVAALANAALTSLVLTGCSDPRAAIDAGHVVDTFAQAGIPVSGISDESASMCADPAPCVQAVITDQLTVWRFADREDAAMYAADADDPHVSDFIVLEFVAGALTPAQRRDAASMVDSMHTSD
jgi:hypothetical protein